MVDSDPEKWDLPENLHKPVETRRDRIYRSVADDLGHEAGLMAVSVYERAYPDDDMDEIRLSEDWGQP